ncbi:hypothetical protein O181_098016 [Austropuccinia psidii MF-1]|uniref:Chromo domain-containing protein n=1 Tax=Austropuccinia psidii MF-1 TaxID=1389203 RepID=A0A9Q3JAJ9_9BASI|nr:hypothetical protein [Austropuccinia psidii MF-1]
MEVSSHCLSCVLSRTSEATNYPKSTSKLPPPPVIVEEQEELEVAQGLDSNLNRGKSLYLVDWKGFNEDPERKAWEPASNLTNSPHLFKDFHTFYPDKPGPNSSRVSFMVFGGDWSL